MGSLGAYAFFVVGDATTWFVFISGYLFYYIESQRFKFNAYISKKLKYVISPYLILSIPALVAGMYFSRAALLGLEPVNYIFWSLSVGGSIVGPMWFIPMIALFFACSPIFNRLAKSSAIYIATVVCVGFSIFSHRPINDLNPFLSFLHFLGFYLLGLAFAKNTHRLDVLAQKRMANLVIVATLVLFLISMFLYDIAEGEPAGFWDGLGVFNLIQLGKLLLLVSVFFIFEKYLNRKSRFLSYMAEISFGLFFIHGFFMLFYSRMMQKIAIANPLSNFLLEFSIVVIASIATVYVLKLILKNKSRYVIGC
jgi:hypothetical protein